MVVHSVARRSLLIFYPNMPSLIPLVWTLQLWMTARGAALHAALLVFEDADIDKAVEWACFGVFWTCGQARGCGAAVMLVPQQPAPAHLVCPVHLRPHPHPTHPSHTYTQPLLTPPPPPTLSCSLSTGSQTLNVLPPCADLLLHFTPASA